MGPKEKTREVTSPADGGTVVSVVSAGNKFGYDTRGNVTPRTLSISSQGVRELRV
jgi:hypothetical protein